MKLRYDIPSSNCKSIKALIHLPGENNNVAYCVIQIKKYLRNCKIGYKYMLIYYYSFERYIRAILFANDMLLSFNSCECNKSFYHVSQKKFLPKINLLLFYM